LSLPSIPDPSVAVGITEQLDKKRRAVRQFASHLKVVAKGQTEPFFKDAEEWIHPEEVFFVDSAPCAR